MKHLTPLTLGASALLLAPLLAATAASQAPPNAPAAKALQEDEADLAGEVEDIIDEYDEELAAFWEAYQATEDQAEKAEIYQDIYPDPADFVERLKVVVDKAPADEASLTAIAWMIENAEVGEYRAAFLSILLEHHSKSDKLGDICSALADDTSRASENFLRALIKSDPSPQASGRAMFALTGLLTSRLDLHESITKMSEDEYMVNEQYYGEEVMELCKALDAKAVRAERKRLLISVRDEYTDVAYWNGTLGKAATGHLYELEHLQIGMVAPDIEGDDLDGVDFKLSDYRGKVVFLDFWGDW